MPIPLKVYPSVSKFDFPRSLSIFQIHQFSTFSNFMHDAKRMVKHLAFDTAVEPPGVYGSFGGNFCDVIFKKSRHKVLY